MDWNGNTHTCTPTHKLLLKPKQWSITGIHILLQATSVPFLRKNWSQNRLLTVNCRTPNRPLPTRKRPLRTHAFNGPAIRVNGGLVCERSDLLSGSATFVLGKTQKRANTEEAWADFSLRLLSSKVNYLACLQLWLKCVCDCVVSGLHVPRPLLAHISLKVFKIKYNINLMQTQICC